MSQRLLSILKTDSTWHLAEWRGRKVWSGKCLICNRHLQLELSGKAISQVTVEHILPRNHGGTDDLSNLALACARCNNEKGRNIDCRHVGDPKLWEVVHKLQEKRRRRWVEPAQ